MAKPGADHGPGGGDREWRSPVALDAGSHPPSPPAGFGSLDRSTGARSVAIARVTVEASDGSAAGVPSALD